MRLSKSSLLRMLLMCALTVATLMNKAAAISALDWPPLYGVCDHAEDRNAERVSDRGGGRQSAPPRWLVGSSKRVWRFPA